MNADDLARRRVIDECPLEDCTWAVTGGSADERVAELTGHLSTHPLTDFITEITRLRQELTAVTQTLTATVERGGLWTP